MTSSLNFAQLCDIESVKGFEASKSGRPIKSNPHKNKPEKKAPSKAWEYGWTCWDISMLPFAVLNSISNEKGCEESKEEETEFSETGKFPDRLLTFMYLVKYPQQT